MPHMSKGKDDPPREGHSLFRWVCRWLICWKCALRAIHRTPTY